MDWMGMTTEDDAWRDFIFSLESCDASDTLLATLLQSDAVEATRVDGHAGRTHTVVSEYTSLLQNESDESVANQRANVREAKRVRATDLADSGGDIYPSAPTKQKKKKIRTGNPVKDNIVRLRESVKEAEAQLALLRSRGRQHGAVGGKEEGTLVANDDSSALWKDVATRQYRWRRESEVANDKLRTVLHEQTKIMHGLQRLIKRSRGVLDSTSLMTFAPYDIEGARYARRVNELMTLTATMRLQVELGLLRIDGDTTTSGTAHPHQRVVPCSPQAVSSALWNYFSRSTEASDAYFRERIQASSDTIVKSFHVRWDNVAHFVNHRGIVVARRFPQPNGLDLVVYTAEMEALDPELPTDESHEAASIAHGFRTQVWTLVRSSDESPIFSEVVIQTVTSAITTTLAEPTATGMRTIATENNATNQIARLAQFSLSRHLERVHRAIDSAFLVGL